MENLYVKVKKTFLQKLQKSIRMNQMMELQKESFESIHIMVEIACQ